jgi:hypothetical protein
MGPGIGYYGGVGVSLILALINIYLLPERGRERPYLSILLLPANFGTDNPLRMQLHQTGWNDRTHIGWQEHESWKTSWL